MTRQDIIKIALVQMSCSEDSRENISKALDNIKKAASKGANIICLPELFKCRYFCQTEDIDNFDLAEKIPGATTKKFSILSKKLKIVILLPVFEKRAMGIYHNSLVTLNEKGQISGLYRKMHIPDDPGYYEKYYFTPGDNRFSACDTKFGKIGTLICWDQWFPEAARLVCLAGADVIFYPSAIGWHPDEKEKFGEIQRDAWINVQRGHAIANGLYVAAVNRVGFEPLPGNNNRNGIEFWGSSFICGPQGEIIVMASDKKEEIIYADIDLYKIETVRRNWPFLRDRRLGFYKDIADRYIDSK